MSERLRVSLRDEGGVTLIELLVASSISLLAGAIFVAALVSVQGSLNSQQTRTENLAQVRLATEQLDREVRSGSLVYNPAEETPANYSLRIYSPEGNNRCIQWRISEGELRRRTWLASYGLTPAPETVSGWRTIATDVINIEVARPAFALADAGTGPAGRTVRIVLLTNVRPQSHPDGTMVIEQSLTARNTTRGSATIQSACTPAPAG